MKCPEHSEMNCTFCEVPVILCRQCLGDCAFEVESSLGAISAIRKFVESCVGVLGDSKDPALYASCLSSLSHICKCQKCHGELSVELQCVLARAGCNDLAFKGLKVLCSADSSGFPRRAEAVSTVLSVLGSMSEIAVDGRAFTSGTEISNLMLSAYQIIKGMWQSYNYLLVALGQFAFNATMSGQSLVDFVNCLTTIVSLACTDLHKEEEYDLAGITAINVAMRNLLGQEDTNSAVSLLGRKGTHLALQMLERRERYDDPTTLECLTFLDVVTVIGDASQSLAIIVPILSASLGKVLELRTQAHIICTLYLAMRSCAFQAELSSSVIGFLLSGWQCRSSEWREYSDADKNHIIAIQACGSALLAHKSNDPLKIHLNVLNMFDLLEQHKLEGMNSLNRGLLFYIDDLFDQGLQWHGAVVVSAVGDALDGYLALLSGSQIGNINTADEYGYTLLHRISACGLVSMLSKLLTAEALIGLNVLVRTPAGANALQLAKQNGNLECVSLLESVTESAAAARRDELLKELDQTDEETLASTRRNSKKKKSVTRTSSFFADQPEEKAQKFESNIAAAAELADRQRAHQERSRQEREYERALEQRRLEIEEEKRQQEENVELRADGTCNSLSGRGPGTPDGLSRKGSANLPNATETTSSNDDANRDGNSSDEAMPFYESLPNGEHFELHTDVKYRDLDDGLSARLQDALFVHDGPMTAKEPEDHQSGHAHSMFGALHWVSTRDGVSDAVVPQLPQSDNTYRASHSGRSEPSPSLLAAMAAAQQVPDSGSDESLEPTRHLWIGNLGTRTPRALLKAIFDRFGALDDVVTFPGRMYAFVNYRNTSEAMVAFNALHTICVPELTGERRLIIKYRPVKKAAAHLKALGLADDDGEPAVDGIFRSSLEMDRDGNSTEPSPRIWLGNIAPTATNKSLHMVLSQFGPLTDAAVFPARIGPLGYAFVKFETVQAAVTAFETLNNSVVPLLSGTKQLKMRYKPANDGPSSQSDPSEAARASTPSRHLWLGNITQKPSEEIIHDIFGAYGRVDSVRVFPVKAYAFVNYAESNGAMHAMMSLEGVPIPCLTGVKPLVMRYQQEPMAGFPTNTVSSQPSLFQPGAMSRSLLSMMRPLDPSPSYHIKDDESTWLCTLGMQNALAAQQSLSPRPDVHAFQQKKSDSVMQRPQTVGVVSNAALVGQQHEAQLKAILNNLTVLQQASQCGALADQNPVQLLAALLSQQQQQQQQQPASSMPIMSSLTPSWNGW